MDHDKEWRIARGVSELRPALTGIHPGNPVLGVRIDWQLFAMFRQPGQRMNDRQKLTDIVRPIRKWTKAENTPRYSSLPGAPLHAASTQMDGRIGLTLASLHLP